MKPTVQARLDDESQDALKHLTRQLGWSPSRVVREGLRLMAQHHGVSRKKKRKFIGMGQFDSGIPDLGSDKKHLEGYGR